MLFKHKVDADFYEILEAQAALAHEAATVFFTLSSDFHKLQESLKKLEAIEHDADRLTHSFVNKVNTHFVTPMDKEDMHALTDRLDSITDTIEAAAACIEIYRLVTPRSDLQILVGMLFAITQETKAMIGLLRHGFGKTEMPEVIKGIHALETRSDKAFRKALMTLFEDETLDTRLLIKWKEVYERIEKAINRCEKLAGFLESLAVKYA